MIFTSYFNYFNNCHRTQSIKDFKETYPKSVSCGISDGHAHLDHALECKDKIFLKENLLNLAIDKHLNDADHIFWIDNDVRFMDDNWHDKALQQFAKGFDVLQLFTSCHHLDANNAPLNSVAGFVYAKQKYNRHGHCGFAWGMTKQAFAQLGGLYEYNIAGTGDAIMARSFIQEKIPSFAQSIISAEKFAYYPYSENHDMTIQNYYNNCKDLRTGYIEGEVYHNYHGELEKRNYIERYKVYENNMFDPVVMLYKDNGVLQIKNEYFQLKTDIERFLEYKDRL